ncbi:hypothetical protein G6F57_015723 [Rhizopus arrhizus]|nr:hypothetical protein G6F57_015723 [Rhizopus arrhizus]
MEGIEHQQGLLQTVGGDGADAGVVQQLHQRGNVVTAEHGAQQFGGALTADQRILLAAQRDRRQVRGFDFGSVINAGRHAVGQQVEQELGLALRRVLQQFDDIGRLLRAQRQRRDAKRSALGDVVAVGFQHDNSRLQALEVVAVKRVVPGDQAVALQQCVGADHEFVQAAAAATALAVAAVHLASAQRRLGFHRVEMHAHLFQRFQHLGTAAQRGADLGQGRATDHHAAADQALPQDGFHRIGLRAIAEQFDQHRRIDGDHHRSVLVADRTHRRVGRFEADDAAAVQLDLQQRALGQAEGITHRLGQGDLSAFCNSGFHR